MVLGVVASKSPVKAGREHPSMMEDQLSFDREDFILDRTGGSGD